MISGSWVEYPGHERGRLEGAGVQEGNSLRAHFSRAEAHHRQGVHKSRQCDCHDWRWSQRLSGWPNDDFNINEMQITTMRIMKLISCEEICY